MKYELLMKYHANLGDSIEVGGGAYGERLIVEVNGGAFEGPNLKGTFRDAAAADWLTVKDGYGHLDVRVTMITNDGANIFMDYIGKLELTENVTGAIAGSGKTDFGDQYFFVTPRFQTGDERYAWLNNIVCVSQGRLLPGRVEYNVYHILND